MSDLLASIRATHRAGAKTWRARRGRSRGEYSVIKAGPHPPCKGCDAALVQRENESNWEFWTRGTCSRSCANKARRSTQARHHAAQGRHCPFCKAEIIQNEGEPLCKFEDRKTCGGLACVNQCRSVSQGGDRSMEPASKQCEVCAVAFFRRDGERMRNWIKRRTCSTEHGYALQSQRRKKPYDQEPAIRLDDMLVNYGAGFHGQDIAFKRTGYARMAGPAINRTLGGVSG